MSSQIETSHGQIKAACQHLLSPPLCAYNFTLSLATSFSWNVSTNTNTARRNYDRVETRKTISFCVPSHQLGPFAGISWEERNVSSLELALSQAGP